MASTKSAPVPLCDVQAQYKRLQPRIEEALSRVLASGQVILGPEVAAFEEEIASYCGVNHGVGCGSGTEALSLALKALDIGPGDEVIVPPFTFFATVGAIVRAGAVPVFVDIDPETYAIDPEQIERRVTERTRAVLVVHLFGQCADMSALWDLAERLSLYLIEDAAQALGSEYQEKRSGSLGAIGCFSFYPSKNLGGFGDSGMVVTNDPEWADKMKCLRVHGMKPKYYHSHMGWNARIDAVQAAMLRVKLPYLDEWLAARQRAAARYSRMIDEQNLSEVLAKPVERPQRKHTYNQYVVEVEPQDRDGLVQHLRDSSIGCEIYYPIPVHLQECLQHLGHCEGDFPASEQACRSVLALPMFPEIRAEQQERVIACCAEYLKNPSRQVA